tara:strand:- start:2706 stop:3506 length:801 start_codon:yes stop_codon:yes gene_type:complete
MTRNRDLGDVAPFVDGVTSNIQTQINAKQATITGAATTIDDTDLTADRAVISDGSGKVAVSSITSTQLATVPNLAPIANPTFTGTVTTPQVNVTAQGSVRMEDAAGGQYAAFQAPTTITTSYIMTMPPNTGNASEFLQTNGSGVLSFSGVSVGTTGFKAVSYNETYVALSGTSPAVDCATGNVFALSTTGNTTFTFTNPPTSGTAFGFTLKVTAGGTHTLTWPGTVDWPGGAAPDAPASGVTNVFVFITYDGGTTWYGFLAGAALA